MFNVIKIIAGSLVLELTGHRNLVTSVSMRSMWPAATHSLLPSKASAAEGETSSAGPPVGGGICTGSTDVIISVSDDKTARVFHVNMPGLLS